MQKSHWFRWFWPNWGWAGGWWGWFDGWWGGGDNGCGC